jgi:hypothetical protein
MLKRIPLSILLAIQALGGGAITLAHARDVVVAPPGLEASHDSRCAILHDEVRCALCQYTSPRVTVQQDALLPAAPPAPTLVGPSRTIVVARAPVPLTAPARAPPAFLS